MEVAEQFFANVRNACSAATLGMCALWSEMIEPYHRSLTETAIAVPIVGALTCQAIVCYIRNQEE